MIQKDREIEEKTKRKGRIRGKKERKIENGKCILQCSLYRQGQFNLFPKK